MQSEMKYVASTDAMTVLKGTSASEASIVEDIGGVRTLTVRSGPLDVFTNCEMLDAPQWF